MTDTGPKSSMLTVTDLDPDTVREFLDRFHVAVEWIADDLPITGSFWGNPEAGVIGQRLFIRSDTPVHSMLHELCHIICMTAERRSKLNRDAGGDDLEESAVCYLQIVLADYLPGVGRLKLMQDMDAWGYSFRLGSTEQWFREDADDALRWLAQQRLVDSANKPQFRLREA